LLTRLEVGDVGISVITVAELSYGAEKSQRPEENLRALEQFLLPFVVVDFGSAAASAYRRVRAHLERRGTPIGSMDVLIAAHALSLEATIVTNNGREFQRVPGLSVEDWSQTRNS
jgi:tRNA(fMet)-specific endonuclease VapC